MIRVAINGYGRIGRVAHRVILERHYQDIEVVAINAGSSTDIKGWMYLLKYDTSYGPIYSLDVSYQVAEENPTIPNLIGYLMVDNKKIPVISQKDATLLPWRDLNVDVVIESTGHLTTEDKLKTHLAAGAKSVVLSAPVKEGQVPTIVLAVNPEQFQGQAMINNASCTTNCIAPVAKVMLESFGVEKAMMTTIHGYTSDQRLQDGGHKDYRRARAAAQNIVPTSTGAAIAAAQALPELANIFGGLSLRVPIAVGSLSDFTFILKREVTKQEINDALRKASQSTAYAGVLSVTEDPLVSSDIIGSPYSAIVDLSLTQTIGNMVKVIAWYDNEYGYANRLVEEVMMVGKRMENQAQVKAQVSVEAQPQLQTETQVQVQDQDQAQVLVQSQYQTQDQATQPL